MCVICSAGGHLAEALAATRETDVDRYFVTKQDAHIKDRLEDYRIYYVEDPHTSIPGYMKNAVQSLWIFMRERPRVILTTGAGIALPTCLFGWIYGSKIIFVESGARVTTMSKTGRLLYRLADVSYVQWHSLQKQYPKSIYVGRLG
ncbi:MAG: UDP-N-acetylglucosamine transferase subunit ALG14 [Gammaproteobacteria bacterium]|nr:UDP-N-acetylglucosamine transferase subunit ALG14 [Gammaproteobacteria bacterium]